jgi:hypothetical protein
MIQVHLQVKHGLGSGMNSAITEHWNLKSLDFLICNNNRVFKEDDFQVIFQL